ncbi:unnamed protein product [Symbiodinium sp. CCMP2592]|nr:unnamed protein product [Symbiodinium sp. CCMP2592]
MRENNVQKTLIHCSGGTPAQYGLVDLGVPRWGYQFGVMVPSADYATGVYQHIMTFENRLPSRKFAFFRNTGNAFTDFTCGESIARAKSFGFVVEDSEIFEFTTATAGWESTLLAGVQALKASGTDMLMGCTWLDDGIALQKAIVAERLNLIANIILIAPTTGRWLVEFPRDENGNSDGDYVLAPSQWHHTQNFTDFSSIGPTPSFFKEFKNATGTDPDYLLASCTTAGIILERAVSRVTWGNYTALDNSSLQCSCDVDLDEKIRLMVRDFEEETMYGRVRFDKFNQNVGHEAAVIQVQKGKDQTSVLPEDKAESRIQFPIPTWEERLACPPNCTDPNIFKIGVISPASGPGPNFDRGLQWWANKVNAAGGMRSLDGQMLKVELVFADTQMNSEVAANKAIEYYYTLTDNVQAMVNTFFVHNIAVNDAMAANEINKVLLHCSGGEPDQYGVVQNLQAKPRWSYAFGVMIPSSTYGAGVFNFLEKQLLNADTDPVLGSVVTSTNGKRIVFFRNVGNSFADYTCGEAISQAAAAGLDVNSTDVFEYNTSDNSYITKFGEWVREAKAKGIGMSMGCTWEQDGIELQRAIIAESWDLILNVILVAPATQAWLDAFPTDDQGRSDGDYVLCPSQWHHTQNFDDTSSVGDTDAFTREFQQEYSADPDYLLASCTAAGIIIENAMRSVNWLGSQSFDDNSFRIAVRDLRANTMYGGVRFDNINQNVGHDAAVIQVRPSDWPSISASPTIQTSVLPETNSARNIIFPAPKWEWRRGCPKEFPDNSDNFSCQAEIPDDLTIYFVIIICTAVPILAVVCLYVGRVSHNVLRKRRAKYIDHWVSLLEAALWDQDEEAVKKAETALRGYKSSWIWGKNPRIDTSELRREQSLQAGVSVAYLISDEFLDTALQATGMKDPTFHDLKQAFFMGERKVGAGKICPRDGRLGVSLIDTLPRQHRQKCTHFLSWSWAYTVRQVRSGLELWIERSGLDPSQTFLFMCFFVNNQHRIVVSGDATGSDDLDSIFEGNLCRIGKMVALLDTWQSPVYLTRIWTIFEQYVAVTRDIEVKIVLPRDAEANLFMTILKGAEGIALVKESLCTVDSASADAWSPQDKEAIQKKILASCGFDNINEHVRKVMINWIGDVVIGAMKRVVNGEDIAASANQWSGKFENNELPSRESTWTHML